MTELAQLRDVAKIGSGKRPTDISTHAGPSCDVPIIGGGGPSGFTSRPLYSTPVLITGRVGTLGKLFFSSRCWPSDNALVIEPIDDRISFEFLRYSLQQRIADAAGLNRGAANPLITQRDLGELTISCPAPHIQRAIAAVLSSLDDKIELNRRMNETLEAQARALFRDWFVDFGPVKAKMAGADPYLAPDLWSLFPDRLDDDGVPEVWSTSNIGGEVETVGGSTPSTANPEFWNGDIAWTTPKDLSGLQSPILTRTARTISAAGLAKISSGLLPAGTVLLSSRAPVGYLAITAVPLAINQGYIAMRSQGRVSNWFAYLWAKEHMDLIVQNANGSTFQEISKKNFRPLPVVVGPDATHLAFDHLVGPLFERITANEAECQTLAETRDLLLPRLMSGEVRVGELAA